MPRPTHDANPHAGAAERPWRVLLPQSEVPQSGLHIEVTADEQVRSRLATVAGVQALPRLSASFDVTPHGRDGLRVVGQLSATVKQTCGVTLELVENAVEETVDVVFRPEAAAFPEASTELEIPLDDEPEPLVNGMIDLGALATEFLILGIDPYPRKPGIAFEPPRERDEREHPFAALAALKRRGEGES